MRGLAVIAAIVILAMLGAVLAVRVWAPGALLPTGGEQVHLAYLVGWVAMLSVAIFAFGRMPLGHAVRSLLIWAGVGLFLVALYALRADFGDLYAEVRGEILPYAPQAVAVSADDADGDAGAASAAAVRRAADGHFWAEAQVNGARVRFLVDTGASTVALTRADARRAGLDPDSLNYTRQVMTAGGLSYGAPVRLDRVSIGGVRLDEVDAIVIENEDLPISLLGMSFLGRLSRYEATQDSLILRK